MTVPQVMAYREITKKKEKKRLKQIPPKEVFCKDCLRFDELMQIMVTDMRGHRMSCGFCIINACYVPFLWRCSKWKSKLTHLDVKLK